MYERDNTLYICFPKRSTDGLIDGFAESRSNTCRFENMKYICYQHSHTQNYSLTLHSALVLEKVCEYFYYNEKNKDAKDVPDMDIPTELSLELLIAADYLDGKDISLLTYLLPKRLLSRTRSSTNITY